MVKSQDKQIKLPLDQYEDTLFGYRFTLNPNDYPFLKGWLKNIQISFTTPFPLTHCFYEIEFGGMCVYRHQLEINQNLIPYDALIPFGLLRYHESKLHIYLSDGTMGWRVLSTSMVIQVTKAEKTIQIKDIDQLEIPWGTINGLGQQLSNSLRITGGMCGLRYHSENMFDCIKEQNIVKPMEVVENIVKFQDHIYREFIGGPISSPEYTKLIDTDANRHLCRYENLNKCYYDSQNQQLVINQMIMKYGDTSTNWKISFAKPLLTSKIQMILFNNDNMLELSYQTSDQQHFDVTSFNDTHHLNVIQCEDPFHLMIKIPHPNQESLIVYDYRCTIQLWYYWWNDFYRHQLVPWYSYTSTHMIEQVSNQPSQWIINILNLNLHKKP